MPTSSLDAPQRLNDSEYYVNIDATQSGPNVILKLTGRMDANNSPDFEKAATVWIHQGAANIIVDMSELAYMSSMGLRYFVNDGKLLQEKGGSLHLSGMHGMVKQLFQITKLNNVFPTHDTVESALAAL
jgi:anti-sigma B factor antagonist